MITITENADLTGRNTMGIRASARMMVEFSSAADLPKVRELATSAKRLLIIGAGSNLLFTGDFDGLIIVPRIESVDFSGSEVTAGAGVTMDRLIAATCERGLWGLENLSGIPGTVGASVVQNVGAYGMEAGDAVKTVWIYDLETGRREQWSRADCHFAYRDSAFKRAPYKLVIGVTYKLNPDSHPRLDYGNLRQVVESAGGSITPETVRDAVISIRNSKLPDPDVTGSAGSFFKNPVITPEAFARLKELTGTTEIPHFIQPDGIKIPAAWLIDRAGLKGIEMGEAAVWHLQPLVIVNKTGHASAADILALENHIVETVKKMSGITLTPEVQHI